MRGSAEAAGLFEPDPSLPRGVSLWALLEAEASDAAAHAGFAVNHPTNLDNIRRHSRHVRHLIDPAAEPNRPMPGREYGVARAAREILDRVAADGAIDAARKSRADRSLRRVLALSDQILENCAAIIAAPAADVAITPARANLALLDTLLNGDPRDDSQAGLRQLRAVLETTD